MEPILRRVIAAFAIGIAGVSAAAPPEPPPPGLSPNASSMPQRSEATVWTPPPVEQLPRGDDLLEFIMHHGTTAYPLSVGLVSGGLLRWRGGRAESICPATVGAAQGDNELVTARLRAVASFVGAPVESTVPCKPNVQIVFMSDPSTLMAAVLKWAARWVNVRFPHQEQLELELNGGHAIQGWYVTARGDSDVLNQDAGLVRDVAIESLWPRAVPTSAQPVGSDRSILSVVLVIDTRKAAGIPLTVIADYLALAALTVIKSPDHCDALPSILALSSTACASRGEPGITSADLAFLKALYYHNTGIGSTLSRDGIQFNMMKQLQGG